MSSSRFHSILIKASSWKIVFLCSVILGLILAGIEVFNTYMLFSNYDNPPPLIPYPAFIFYLSFSLAVPSIQGIRTFSTSFSINRSILLHLVIGLIFVSAHIFLSNLSDWYFYDRDWSIVGSFQFVFTTRFLYELLIYFGIVGIMFALNNIKLKYEDTQENRYPTKIEIKKSRKVFFVKTENISWIEANDNYINIYDGTKTHLLRKKLKEIKQDLDPSFFQQVHRSSIVNLTKVKELELHNDGGCIVHLVDGTTIKATKTYKQALQNWLAKN